MQGEQAVLADSGAIIPESEQARIETHGLNTARLKRFAELSRTKTKAKANLDEIETEMKQLEAGILEEFQEQGLQNMKIDGMTLYLHEQIWASAADGDKANTVKVFKENGLDMFVKEDFNTQTVSGWVRERITAVHTAEEMALQRLEAGDQEGHDFYMAEASREDIPDVVKAALKISPTYGIRARKG